MSSHRAWSDPALNLLSLLSLLSSPLHEQRGESPFIWPTTATSVTASLSQSRITANAPCAKGAISLPTQPSAAPRSRPHLWQSGGRSPPPALRFQDRSRLVTPTRARRRSTRPLALRFRCRAPARGLPRTAGR